MSGYDPCQVVFDALERHDCSPRGPVYKFSAKCPAHEDRSPSLIVGEGVDRRAVLFCYAGCENGDIVKALGLRWSHLFPSGHRHAPKARQPKVVTDRPIISVLAALNIAGIGYRNTASVRTFVADNCPKCNAGSLWVHDSGDVVRMSCWSSGCESTDILAKLEDLVTESPW